MNAHTKTMITVFGVPVLKQKLDTERAKINFLETCCPKQCKNPSFGNDLELNQNMTQNLNMWWNRKSWL